MRQYPKVQIVVSSSDFVRVYRVGLVRNEIGKLINSFAGGIIKDLLILVFLVRGDITHGEGPNVQCGDGWNPYDQLL